MYNIRCVFKRQDQRLADYRHPERFLGLDDEQSTAEDSAAWVLPLPLEMTTSYIGGTKQGPAAIIEASNQVELYDWEFDAEVASIYGIHTLPTLHPTLASPQAAFESIREAVGALPIGDKLLVTLGGEHALTPGLVAALAPRYPGLIMVQIDAHSDLRDEYEGTRYSHACAARRVLPYASIIQFGIRSACEEEVRFAQSSDQVEIIRAEAMHRDSQRDYLKRARDAVAGRPVYLSIDLDGLDPSVIRATGTPEPGGIGWYDCLDLIKTVAASGQVVALDCVELCPSQGEQASAFAAAKLVYKVINYVMQRGALILPTTSQTPT